MDIRKQPHTKRAKDKIRTGHILRRLLKHFDGSLELTASQVNVGLALLKKKLPDLKQMEHTGEVSHKHTEELSRDELLHIAAAGRAGSSEKGRSSGEPKKLH
jgi:hypothetical protein